MEEEEEEEEDLFVFNDTIECTSSLMSSTLLLPPADRRRRRLETEISRLQTQGIVPEEEVNKLQATEQQLQQTKATVTQLELKEKDVQSQEQMIILKSDLAASQNKTHTFWNN